MLHQPINLQVTSAHPRKSLETTARVRCLRLRLNGLLYHMIVEVFNLILEI